MIYLIHLITGIPGSGKSLVATSLAVKFLKKGVPVFSNYPIQCKSKGHIITSYKLTKELLRSQSLPFGSKVFIDEAQLWFGSRSWKDFTIADLNVFSQHRHYGLDLFIITQHAARIDTVIREIANIIWVLDRFFLVTVATGFYEYEHLNVILNNHLIKKRKKIFLNLYLSRFYKCYDTFFLQKPVQVKDFINWDNFDGCNYKLIKCKKLFRLVKGKISKGGF